MDKETWTAFRKAVKHYRLLINKTEASLPLLSKHIQKLVNNREGPSYTVKTPVVYNEALDEVNADSEIKMILVGDNPGRREQENCRYLVGPSGKIAEKFFRENRELGIDFRKNVLILNKTPIHTPRTTELKTLCSLGGKQAEAAVLFSQQEMAKLLYEFWETLSHTKKKLGVAGPGKQQMCPAEGGSEIRQPDNSRKVARLPYEARGDTSPPLIWIIGYSEMKKGGIFEAYTETLGQLCTKNPVFRDNILFFRHFSMNQFTIDLKKSSLSGENLTESLHRIGKMYRERVLY